MTAALVGGEWSAARPGRTLPSGKTRYPFYRRLSGSQGRSERAENLVPTGIRSRNLQPVVSRYTDWATRPNNNNNNNRMVQYFACVWVRKPDLLIYAINASFTCFDLFFIQNIKVKSCSFVFLSFWNLLVVCIMLPIIFFYELRRKLYKWKAHRHRNTVYVCRPIY